MWEEQIDIASQYNKVDNLRKKIMEIKIYLLISNLTWKKKISMTSHLSKSELRKKSTTVWKFQDKPQWVNTGIILTINGKWTER